jgi:ABC-type transport system involved in multi-copper enzyme maturation permease subunit
MSKNENVVSTAKSEWIKFRTVNSTIVGIALLFFLTIGFSLLITLVLRAHWDQSTRIDKLTFDPVSTSLVGVFFAQFAVGVIGVLFISAEYSSGSIRTTLAAVPNRVRLVTGKVIVLFGSMFIVCEVVTFVTFLMGQAVFSGVVPTASLSSGSVLRAVILTGVYLALLTLLGFALGLILRQSAASISVFVVILLIVPLISLSFPESWRNDIERFELGNLWTSMASTTTPSHLFTAWSAFAALVIYVVAFLAAGTVLLQTRDA